MAECFESLEAFDEFVVVVIHAVECDEYVHADADAAQHDDDVCVVFVVVMAEAVSVDEESESDDVECRKMKPWLDELQQDEHNVAVAAVVVVAKDEVRCTEDEQMTHQAEMDVHDDVIVLLDDEAEDGEGDDEAVDVVMNVVEHIAVVMDCADADADTDAVGSVSCDRGSCECYYCSYLDE